MDQPPDQPAQPSRDPEPGPQPARAGDIDYAAWALVGGGFLILLGIFLKWFSVTANIAGFSGSISKAGTEDWTGVVALIAALVAIGGGGAAILMTDARIKRSALMAATIAGVIALVVTVIAFFRANSVGVELPVLAGGPNASIDAGAAAGLYVSFLGAVIATAGGVLSARRPAAVA
jgi:hypothetical protein